MSAAGSSAGEPRPRPTRLLPMGWVRDGLCQAGHVTAKRKHLLIALLVAYVVAVAVASGFGFRTVAVTGWLTLAGVFAVVTCVQLVRRRRG